MFKKKIILGVLAGGAIAFTTAKLLKEKLNYSAVENKNDEGYKIIGYRVKKEKHTDNGTSVSVVESTDLSELPNVVFEALENDNLSNVTFITEVGDFSDVASIGTYTDEVPSHIHFDTDENGEYVVIVHIQDKND